MAHIKIVLPAPPVDGMDIKFQAPCDCTAVTGLILQYPAEDGNITSKEFTFRDAHGNDLTGLGNLFSRDSYVKVIVDTKNGYAYIQNADTNAYLEKTRFQQNLVDNGDFSQFVAQAGIGGKHGNDTYAGDRWILDSGTVTGEANENGNGYKNITLTGTIRQKIANPPAVGTVGVEMISGTATVSYENGEVTVTSNGGVIGFVKLFEGKYTDDNMPKAQPKGYGAELAECQRYFVRLQATESIHDHALSGLVTAGTTMLVCSVYLPAYMRINPTVTNSTKIIVRGTNGYSTDTNNAATLANIATYCLQGNVLSLLFTKPDGSAWNGITNNTPIVVEFEMGYPVDISADL